MKRHLGGLLAGLLLLASSCDYSAKQREAWKLVLRLYVAVSTCDGSELPQYVAYRAFRNRRLSDLQESVGRMCAQRGKVVDLRKLGSSQIEGDSPKTDGRLYCVNYRMGIEYAVIGRKVESIQVCSDEGEPGAPYRITSYEPGW